MSHVVICTDGEYSLLKSEIIFFWINITYRQYFQYFDFLDAFEWKLHDWLRRGDWFWGLFCVIFCDFFSTVWWQVVELQTVCVQNADFQIVHFLSHNYMSYSYSENLHIISKQFDPQAPDVKNTSISTEIFRGTIMITTVQGIILLIVIHSTFASPCPIITLWHHGS